MLQSRQNQQAAGPETAAPGNDAPGVETVAPSSNAAALEALQAQGLDEEAPGGDVDGSAQGTGGQATAAPPGGGPPEDAWWVPFVRALSPEAAALLDKGVLGLAGEAIDGAVEGGLGSIDMAIDPEGWATEMQAALVGAIDMFSGVLAGDPTCCCMLEDACNAFMDGAQFLITNLSPGAAAFNALGGSIDAVLEAFGTILSLDGVQGVIDGIGSFVQDIIDEVAEWARPLRWSAPSGSRTSEASGPPGRRSIQVLGPLPEVVARHGRHEVRPGGRRRLPRSGHGRAVPQVHHRPRARPQPAPLLHVERVRGHARLRGFHQLRRVGRLGL